MDLPWPRAAASRGRGPGHGPFDKDSDPRCWGLELASRDVPTAKKTAVIAVARKRAVLSHRLWQTGEVYELLRTALR